LKHVNIINSLFCDDERTDSTYKELKPIDTLVKTGLEKGTDSTYKELKQYSNKILHYYLPRTDSTYKELKPNTHSFSSKT